MNTIITSENYDSILETVRKQSIHERDTQTILQLFFFHENWTEYRIKKNGSSMDNPHLYEYEISINKKIFEMEPEELLNLLLKHNRRNGAEISQYTYRWIYYMCTAVWKFYIESFGEGIRNPWIRREMTPAVVSKRLIENKEPLTVEILEDIIADAKYILKDPEHCEYAELFIRLLYEGVPSAREIIEIKEDQIDFTNNIINCEYRIVHISDRTATLLKRVHCFVPFITYKQGFHPTSYRGSYVPILVKKNYVDSVNERTIDNVAAVASKTMNTLLDKRAIPKDIYQLGFFDFIVNKVGRDEAVEIIANSTQRNTMKLMSLVGQYGYNVHVMETVRKNMKVFYKRELLS